MKQQDEPKLRQELIKTQHNNNEKTRQVIRKSISPSSRFLDNYFNSKMHGNAWKPNGQVQIKKKYTYTQTGLSHIYPKNNVIQKLELDKKKELAKPQQRFIEYDYMKNDDIIITIEHCNNCEDHQTHTHHINDIYKNFARILQKCIMLRFPFIKIILKQIDTEIITYNENIHKMNKNVLLDELYQEVRIGAMEVQLAIKRDDHLEITTIHSKLQSGTWPSISTVLNKIMMHMPMVCLDIKVYDKEEGLNAEDESEGTRAAQSLGDFLFTKYENIKINLYQLKCDKIKELSEIASQELKIILNPKKRKDYLQNARIMEKESYSKCFDTVNLFDNNQSKSIYSLNLKDSSIRPFTGRSEFSSFSKRMSSRASSASTGKYSLRPVSSLSQNIHRITSQLGNNFSEIYEYKEAIDNLKGMLIKSQFTDKEGCTIFRNLPHDCYLLEIEDSKNFQSCASIIKFNKIFKEIQIEKNGVTADSKENKIKQPIMKKFFGLKRQAYSYVEIYIYYNHSENKNDINFQSITGSEVILRRLADHIVENNFFDEDENKVKVKENKKIAGRHDIVIFPGNFLLEVNKKGFEKVRKEIEFTSGLNSITVELIKQKKIVLKISVFDYFIKTPLENVKINLTNSNSDQLEEGLSDKEGISTYEVLDDEGVFSILAFKEGYYSSRRNFILESSSHIITKNQLIETKYREKSNANSYIKIKTIFLCMIKENLFIENKQSLLLLYSNKEDYLSNLESNFLLTELINDSVNITKDDIYIQNGVVSYAIKKKDLNNNDEYPEIIRLLFKIKRGNDQVKSSQNNNNWNHSSKFNYEAILITENGKIFSLPFPENLKDETWELWDMGILDIKSNIFYETGLILRNNIERISFLKEWLLFLQILIDYKIYSNIFDLFQFNKGISYKNDKLLHEPAFIRAIKSLQAFDNNKEPISLFQCLSIEFLIFLCDAIKDGNKMISFLNFKRKVSLNLRNFDIKFS